MLLKVFVIAGMFLAAYGTAMEGGSIAAEILVGSGTMDITPKGTVALAGQMHTRISTGLRSPLIAAALALESRRDGNEVLDQAIIISCDLISIPDDILDGVRKNLKKHIRDFDATKLVLNATHTHTGPVLREGLYEIPKNEVLQPTEYIRFLVDQLSHLAIRVWEDRKPGAVGWGVGQAVVAQNRRAVYADGKAIMYGKTDDLNFRGFEGYEDHDVNVLFFWDANKILIAVVINVACPAQVMESSSYIDADFWHEVRIMLRERFSQNLTVLGWIAAAGDQSPHLMHRKRAEDRMRELRGLTRIQEIARRICKAVNDVYEVAIKEIKMDVPLIHKVETINLPVRMVTDEEVVKARERIEALSSDPRNSRMVAWHEAVVSRYQLQKTNPYYEMELHVIRVGDVAICTNPFELFTDFGIQIKARSNALQTFIIQLSGSGTYVPTEKAVKGRGYSATVESNLVGPEGGHVLVDKTVKLINSLFSFP